MLDEITVATQNEIAEKLNVKPATVRSWRKRRGFPNPITANKDGEVVYSVDAVKKWIEKVSFASVREQADDVPEGFRDYI